TVTAGLRAVGVRIEPRPDGFVVRGTPARPRGGTVDAAGDHRIAMLGAVAGAVSREGVKLDGAESVGISFPGFFELLDSASLCSWRSTAPQARARARSPVRWRSGWAFATSTRARCTAA